MKLSKLARKKQEKRCRPYTTHSTKDNRKKILKDEEVKALFDLYGVEY
jgi:hypothetical protein